MATFISLGNYTAQGISSIKDSPSRLDAARARLGAFGVNIKDFYLTMGQYDLVAVVEAPDSAAVAKGLMVLGMSGNVGTVTMAALTESEYREVVSDLP